MKDSPLDQYGVPIARIAYRTGENERRMAADMYDTIQEILHAAKAEILPFEMGKLEPNGSAIHEHGTCRMGNDPKRSALNAFNQMHEVEKRLRGGWFRLYNGIGKESYSDDFGSGMASHKTGLADEIAHGNV